MYVCLYVFGLLLGGLNFWNGCSRLGEGDFFIGLFMMSFGAITPLLPSLVYHKRLTAQTVKIWAKMKYIAR